MMQVPSSLEYLCRVCAANTKGKKSVAECVYIFKNSDLKQKIEKHLLLKVCESDALPKVLCKTCYRKVEDIAALTNIAKHTHEVFNDYLINNSAKTLKSNAGCQNEANKQDVNNTSDKNMEKLHIDRYKLPSATPPPMVFLPGVSLSDVTKASTPFLAEMKNNIALGNTHFLNRENLQKNNNAHRKQSLMLDTKYAPKSIAQKSLNLTIPQQKKDSVITSNHSNKKHSPPGVISFFPAITKQPLVNTLAGGNYLMSRLNSVAEKDAYRKLKSPSQVKDLNCPANVSNWKRKTASRSTTSDKNANHVVSLLKICSQKQNISVPYTTESNSSPTDNLSHKPNTSSTPLICSWPENNKLPGNGTSPENEFPEEILLGKVIKDIDLLKLILKALKWAVNKDTLESQIQRLRSSKFTDIISDPNLLQDTDLTQLLGPYLAPVLQTASAFQQQHQLFNALQSQNSAQVRIEAKPIQLNTNDLNRAIPYKLPPETSVQLVPALPEETDITKTYNSNSNSCASTLSFTSRKSANSNILNLNSSQSIKATISKSKHSDRTEQYETKDKQSSSSIAIPSAFARKQKNSSLRRLNKSGNSKVIALNAATSNQCEAPINIDDDDDDDIVLVEQPNEQASDNKTCSNKATKKNIEKTSIRRRSIDCIGNTPPLAVSFNEPSAAEAVTSTRTEATTETVVVYARPIAKRRKTVIHTTMREKSIIQENILPNLEQGIDDLPTVDEMKAAQAPSVPVTASTRITEESRLDGEPNDTSLTTTDHATTTGTMPMGAETDSAETCIEKAAKRRSNSRSALGQHLLEAVGIQKVADQNESVGDSDVSSSNTGKESAQQIRSAAKRSLKQAQEQQHSKLKFGSIEADNEVASPASVQKPCESKEMPPADNDIEDNQGKNTTSNDFSKSPTMQKQLSVASGRARHKLSNAEETSEHDMGKIYDMDSTEKTSVDLAVGETNASSLSAAETTTHHKLPGRRRGRKRNADKFAEALNTKSKHKYQKVDQIIVEESLRRPTRQSKTNSKYYKGPEKSEFPLRTLPSRATRNKKNS